MVKTEEALETFRRIAKELLEDVTEGTPARRIHQHIYALVRTLESVIEEMSKDNMGKHADSAERTDFPSRASGQVYPGGRHRKANDWFAKAQEIWFENQMSEDLSEEEADAFVRAMEEDQGYVKTEKEFLEDFRTRLTSTEAQLDALWALLEEQEAKYA